METFQRFLLVSAIVLFIIVFYQWLMKYLRRKDINDPFPYVYPFDKETLSGQETLKFDMPYAANVKAEIYSEQNERLLLAFDQEIDQGIHVMALDLSSLPSGKYELKITFPNQTIRRSIGVSN
jgi:hypothetical protein